MTFKAIVATDLEQGIGKDGDLPWGRDLPADLNHFKEVTMNRPIIMGRKTFESLPNGALPGRQNIVLTNQKKFSADGCDIVHSGIQVVNLTQHKKDAFIIGGEQVYKLFLPITDVVHRTVVHDSFDCDTFFPALNGWKVVENEHHEADNKNKYDYTFQKLIKQTAA